MLELNSPKDGPEEGLPVVQLDPARLPEGTVHLPDVDDVAKEEETGPLSFREHLWDRFELLWARRVVPSRKMLEGFVSCMRERAQLERQYARGLMQSVAKLQQTTSEGAVPLPLEAVVSNLRHRAEQCAELAEELDQDVAGTVEEVLEQHAEVSRRLYADGLCLMRHWHTVRKGHEAAEERYIQACRAAETEAIQCAALSALKPAEWKQSAEKTIQASRQAVAAEKEFQKTLHKFNDSVELQEKQMSVVLDAAQDMEEKRALCFKDAVMKIAVFDTSWLRNVQYDIDSCVQAIEESDGVQDLQDFIRRNRTQVPLPTVRGPRPHWELAGRRDPQTFPERELQRQRLEEFRPLLRSLLHQSGEKSQLPSEELPEEVGRLCRLLAGTAAREGVGAREPSAVVRAGFCGALRCELNPTATADDHGEPPSAAVVRADAFNLATALFKAATDGADAESDVWNGRELLVLSKFIQLGPDAAEDDVTEEPRDDVLLRIYDHPLWSRVTFWDDLLLAGLAEAHFQLVLSRWVDPQGLSGSLSGFATSVDAASAKREIQEVVMTPFLQRYMAYMISLGISFQQAKGATTRTLQKHVELLGTSYEAYLRLITHDAEALPRAFTSETEKQQKDLPPAQSAAAAYIPATDPPAPRAVLEPALPSADPPAPGAVLEPALPTAADDVPTQTEGLSMGEASEAPGVTESHETDGV